MSKNKKVEEETPKTFKEKTLAFLKETGIVIGLFLIINNFVIASFLVPTGSMENEVMTGELLFVNKFIYGGTSPLNLQQLDILQILSFGNLRMPNVPLPWFRLPAFRDVRRGDVIVFVFPGYRDEAKSEEFQFYLKRCIGITGDTILIKNRVVYVNGQMTSMPRHVKFDHGWSVPSNEPDDRIFPAGSGWNEDNWGPIAVPRKGDIICLNAKTSPSWLTLIKREGHSAELNEANFLIDGKPATSYTVEQDYVFGMGDHRDNSLDGRFWGFIPKNNLVGTPMIVYWSWDTNIPLYNIFGRLASVRWGRIGSLIK